MRIGILYNTIDTVKKGKDIEKLADNEVLETAAAVEAALKEKGHDANQVKLDMAKLPLLHKEFDIIFNLAESVEGETTAEVDIAKGLEMQGIPFTGCGSKSMQLCGDKEQTKKILMDNDIPTPKYQIFNSVDDDIELGLEFPLFVKPLHEDASIGIDFNSYVRNPAELRKKVKEILESYKQPALVEEYIDGQEINAAIIGNPEKLEVLPLSEIVFTYPKGVPKMLTFEAKWLEDSEIYKNSMGICPAKVSKTAEKKISEIARKCFEIMGCNGYARVDFRLRNNVPYVLEVNPNPCINPNGTGFVRSSNCAGLSYADMVQKIVTVSVKDVLVKV
jgi:D-alanine-D-alanine ligase